VPRRLARRERQGGKIKRRESSLRSPLVSFALNLAPRVADINWTRGKLGEDLGETALRMLRVHPTNAEGLIGANRDSFGFIIRRHDD